jgi:hypothetical protein
MSELNDMSCAELADVAAELALGVLTGRERAMAVAHLDQCDACREDVRQLMATGEQLLELLPPAEPPAGFETRVLDRLGLLGPAQGPVPAQGLVQAQGPAATRVIPRRENDPRHRRPAWGRARPGTERPGTERPGGDRPNADRPGAERPGVTPARPGGTIRAGRMRRALAATAIGLAVIAAGLGGWRIGAPTSPSTSSAAAPLTSASLLSATHRSVGKIFLYSGSPRWLYMSVDTGSGSQSVTCQVVGTDGKVTTIGSFQLADGYGAWGSPDPGNVGTLSGARLLSANGTVLATATFTHW